MVGSTFRWLASWVVEPSPAAPSAPYSEEFKRQYPNAPIFFAGGYMEAVRHARAHGRLLFVYLHAPAHDDTPAFCRNVLCNISVVNYLHENCIPFVSDIKQSEGYQLQGMLMAGGFPFVAALAPQASSEGSVGMVMKHHGAITSDALIAQLLPRVEAHRAMVAAASTQRQNNGQYNERKSSAASSARSLIEQQDREFKEMEAADRRKREAAIAEESRIAAERDAKQREEEEAKRKQEQEELSREMARAAAEEKRARLSASLAEEPATTGAGIATISVRLPAGTKVSRRFLESTIMQSVFDWVDSNDLQNADGHQVTRYHLLSNFPRRIHSDRDATIGSLKLGRQVMLVVEEIVDDDQDDEKDADHDNDVMMQTET